MGHQDLATTQRYLQFKPRQDAARRISAAFQDGASEPTPACELTADPVLANPPGEVGACETGAPVVQSAHKAAPASVQAHRACFGVHATTSQPRWHRVAALQVVDRPLLFPVYVEGGV
jgi:hypothetical protein